MPLTQGQWRCLHYPWKYTDEDLFNLMYVLSDVSVWNELGQYRFAYLLKVYYVAKQRRITIPPLFEQHIYRISNTTGMFIPNTTYIGHE